MRGWIIVALVGCNLEHGIPANGNTAPPPDSDDTRHADATITPDAPFATGPFGTPTLVSVSSASFRDDDVTLTGDMLEMFWESDRATPGESDIYTARRASVTDAWSLPSRVDELSSTYHETSMEVSTDGLTIYFSSNRPPSTNIDVYVATRPDRTSPWSTPALVSSLSSASSNEYSAQPWSDTVLYLGSDRMPARGGSDIFRATRSSTSAAWSTPGVVPGLDTMRYEGEAFADATGAIWFTSDAEGDDDLWYAKPAGDGTFQTPEIVKAINTQYAETDAWLSPDGHTLYFTSTRNGGQLDIFMATR